MSPRHALTGLMCAALAMPALGHELEGVWKFEKETNTRADGTRVEVAGPEYDGLLIYTADGHVSATVMPRGRRWNVDDATRDQLHASVGEGSSTAYAGRYEIDAAHQTVVHIPSVSVDPADIGKRLVRRFRVEGDRLELSGQWRHQDEELTFTVHWTRVATHSKKAH